MHQSFCAAVKCMCYGALRRRRSQPQVSESDAHSPLIMSTGPALGACWELAAPKLACGSGSV